MIAAFHRPSVYEAHPIDASQWDGAAFVFRGDLIPGNYIPMIRFPDEAFDCTEPQRVPTLAAMDGLVGGMAPGDQFLPSPAVALSTHKVQY